MKNVQDHALFTRQSVADIRHFQQQHLVSAAPQSIQGPRTYNIIIEYYRTLDAGECFHAQAIGYEQPGVGKSFLGRV
jgi:hypothetical protein